MRNLDSFIIILYAAITIFFIYRLVKAQLSKKNLTGEVHSFQRSVSGFEIALFSVLLVTAIINFYTGYNQANNTVMITAAIMLLLAITFVLASRSKLYISENGMIANSSFYNFKDIKKWGFDPQKGDLVLQIKQNNQSSNEIIRVDKKDVDEINTLIRRYKLNK